MKNFYLGIDFGTSSIKAILQSLDGEKHKLKVNYLSNTVSAYNIALKEIISLSLQKINGGNILAISFSSQVGTYIINEQDVISWQSPVSKDELKYIKKKITKERFVKEISMPHPDIISYPLPRLLYIKSKYGNGATILQPKDLLIKELIGEAVTDVYSMRGIVNLQTGKYAKGIMEELGLDFVLPKVKFPTDLAGCVTPEASTEYNLPIGTKIYLGCNDFYAGLIGMGIYSIGDAFELSGTSEHIGYISSSLDEESHVSGAFFNGFCNYGGTKSSGTSCAFAINNFGIEDLDFDALITSNPPIFLPYLQGERAPIYDENARGVYFGLNEKTTKSEMAYATLEGVVFSLYDIIKSMNAPKFNRLICGGGSSSDKLMAKLKAELFDAEIVNVVENDASALGAVILAMVGNGEFLDVQTAIKHLVEFKGKTKPSGKYRQLLFKRFSVYRSIYNNLKDTFKEFSSLKEN